MVPQHLQRDGRQSDGSGTASRLRFLQLQTTHALLQRSPDRHHGSVPIDITPFKTKQFAASHAGSERKEHRKAQRRVLQEVKKSETLLLAESHHLLCLGARRRCCLHWIVSQQLPFDATRKRIPPVEHQFKPGNPRPNGSRNKLGEAFIADRYETWKRRGIEAIERTIDEHPGQYLRVIAMLMPKDMNVNVRQLDDLSDKQLLRRLQQVTGLLDHSLPAM